MRSIDDICYPKRTDVAVVDDKTFVLHSTILVDGRFSEAFYLVKEYSNNVDKVVIYEGFEVYDMDVCRDSLFFVGRKGYDLGFVAKANINNFFASGEYDIMFIPEAYMIDKVKAYKTNSGTISSTCLMRGNSDDTRDAVLQIPNVNFHNYTICRINPRENNRESVYDILEYRNYVLLAGYSYDTTNTNSNGWTIRKYNKNNIAQNFPTDDIILSNSGYENESGFPFLAKSKDEKKLVLVSIFHEIGRDSFFEAKLRIFELGLSIGNIVCSSKYEIVPNNTPMSMLWGADIAGRRDGTNYDLSILSYSGLKTSVFDFKFPASYHGFCNVFHLADTSMFSSIKTYSDKYFVCVGDRNTFQEVVVWDRSTDISYSDCNTYDIDEYYNLRAGLQSLERIPDIEYRASIWENEHGNTSRKIYRIECSYEEIINQQ